MRMFEVVYDNSRYRVPCITLSSVFLKNISKSLSIVIN